MDIFSYNRKILLLLGIKRNWREYLLKKGAILVFTIMFFILMACGCGGNDSGTPGSQGGSDLGKQNDDKSLDMLQPLSMKNLDETMVKGVKLGMEKNEVISILGTPEEIFNDPILGTYELRYDGMIINLEPGGQYVNDIFITGKGIPTHRGIEVGDSVEDVRKAYGSTPYFEEAGTLVYATREPGFAIKFETENGRVKMILVFPKYEDDTS